MFPLPLMLFPLVLAASRHVPPHWPTHHYAPAACHTPASLCLQDKMAALSGPQDQLFSQVQQLERVLKDKQAQLSAAAKQVGRCGRVTVVWWAGGARAQAGMEAPCRAGTSGAGRPLGPSFLGCLCLAAALTSPTVAGATLPASHRTILAPSLSRHLLPWLARRRRSRRRGASGCNGRLTSAGQSSCRWG